MNQAIIFTDNEYYNTALSQIEFQAQSQGTLISCVISLADLKQLSEADELVTEKSLESKNNAQNQALAMFENARFDIEDIAEEMINQQAFSEDGKIYLKMNGNEE